MIKQKDSALSLLELRQLLVTIKDRKSSVGVRFRLLGQMWLQHFSRVVVVTENRVLLNDENNNRLLSIEVGNIIQFEIESRFYNLEPNFHYDVTPN